MINEKHGLPDIIKEIILENKSKIISLINTKNDNTLFFDINEKIKINNKNLFFMCKVNLNFLFNEKYNYTGDINFEICVKTDFQKCIINIYLPYNFKVEHVFNVITHEFTHLYELYQIKDIFDKTKWNRSIALSIMNDMSKLNYSYLNYFRNLFYLSLPHEISARISSIHMHLGMLRTNDKNILMNELKNSLEWKYYLWLNDFDVNYFYDKLKKQLSLERIIEFFNFFNYNMKIKYNIENENDIISYLQKIRKYFHTLSIYYKKKMLKIVYEIHTDDKHGIEEHKKFLSLDEMILLDKPNKEKEILYQHFF